MAIASCSSQCLRYFKHLTEEAERLESESLLPAAAVGDELGRFKVWAGNIGALQRDSRSLDYRLREASQVVDQVTKILLHLEFSLRECIEIVSGRRVQKQGALSDGEASSDEFSDMSDSDSSEGPTASADEQEPVSEIGQLHSAITDAITSLYKLSLAIRNPTPRDRYAKVASSTPFGASYDVGHVYEKFPHARSKAWLTEKLGRAITRRREFLRYREKHRERLGGNIRPPTDLNIRHELADARRFVTNNDAQTQTMLQTLGLEAQSVSHSQLASTKATTYVANLDDESLDVRSIADRSETSYVTSVAEDDSENMRPIPEPPKGSANGMPFECPYCFTIQSVRNSKHWRKHLFSDLKPYICTFEDCSAQMFESRQMWFQHEMDKHRKEWRCKFCSCELFASIVSLESHLLEEHSEYTNQQTSSLIALCEDMPETIAASACPFCDWDASLREQTAPSETHTEGTPLSRLDVSLDQFQRHVGNHLEQLALFAIPPLMEESSGASSNKAAASHNSDHTTDSLEGSTLSSALTDSATPPELYTAVFSGDTERVVQEMRKGADLTLQYGKFGSILQAAAASLSGRHRNETLQTLMDNGADANMQGGVYGNALQAVAAEPGVSGYRIPALELLLDYGAEVNAAGGRYGHALIAAAAITSSKEPTSAVLRFLLDRGADPDAQEPRMYASALHQAIKYKDEESVQLLLDRGASPTIDHLVYGTPVRHAMISSSDPVLRLFRKVAPDSFLTSDEPQPENGWPCDVCREEFMSETRKTGGALVDVPCPHQRPGTPPPMRQRGLRSSLFRFQGQSSHT